MNTGKIQLKKKIPVKQQQKSIDQQPTNQQPTNEQWFLDEPIEYYSWKPDGIYINNAGESMLLPNNKQFINWLNKKYNHYKLSDELKNTCEKKLEDTEKLPFSHQSFVSDFMSPKNPYRGILLNHNLGSGKTRTAVMAAEQYRLLGVRIIILSPATLKPTWLNQLKMWGNSDIRQPSDYGQKSITERASIDALIEKKIAESYDLISYNAPNTLDLLKKAVGGQLKHRFIIVDEVHNLISMMVNPKGKKGYQIYQTLMDAVDCKFMFLSATPLLNSPFELGILFNILKGYMMYKGTRYTLFPEEEAEFENYFIDYETQKIRNPQLFKKRVLGLVSYYYGAKGGVYPQLVIHPPYEIEFSDYQFSKYAIARQSEMEKEAKSKSGEKQKLANLSGTKATATVQLNKDKISSTFRIFSRQFSNYVFPEKIKRPLPRDYSILVKTHLNPNPDKWTVDQVTELMELFDDDVESYDLFVSQFKELTNDLERVKYLQETIESFGKQAQEFKGITSDEEQFIYQQLELPSSYQIAIENSLKLLDAKKEIYFDELLDCLGPKMEMMYRNIMEGEGSEGMAFIYSQFRTLEGVNIFARVLQAHGFELLPFNQINASNIGNYVGLNRYVIYSGEEDNQIRDKILWIYNHSLNRDGHICKVFLGTAAAAEGISLRNTKQVHILEPYWNEVRIQQAIGRARRICSHEDLPENQRKVHVFRYHMILSKEQQQKFGETESTDEAIYRIAKTKETINAQFLQILKDASIDCYLNAYHNITADNPISCFAFDEKETGISFYPSLGEDTVDKLFMINYKQEKVTYAVFNLYGPEDSRFYNNGEYLYVYKYSGDPKIIKNEKIRIPSKNNIVLATVLYDRVIAQSGNMFVPRKAIVGKFVLPDKVFELVA